MVAIYTVAVLLPLGVILLAVRLALPAFVFEHLMVLLVVAFAVIGGWGPSFTVAIAATIGDNVLLREPIGRPAITGLREAVDFGLFVVVAATVGWLVNRLRTARERALAAAERERAARDERDRIVATVTHDLAAPLGAILGTIQFARKHTAVSELDLPRLLGRVETAATRATSLVRALADVKSIDEDALSLNLRHIDLCEIVEPIVRMLDRASERHPLVLAVETPPVIVSGDGERLGRVVENLITNAIKYSPGGGAIEVRLRRDNEFAVLTVADSGIGIPAHARERVFDIGFRTAEAARVAPGMGLGLHIAAEVVRRHGGRIEAEARDTGGAVFSVRLPIAADAAAVTGYGAA